MFNSTPAVRVAVTTIGVRFRVFGDLQRQNVMDPALEDSSAQPATESSPPVSMTSMESAGG